MLANMIGLDVTRTVKTLWRELALTPPINIYGFMERLGIDYEEEPYTPEIAGVYAQTGTNFYISVNSNYPKDVRVLAALHETMHWVLNKDRPVSVCKFHLLNPVMNEEERICTRFAYEMILPEHLLIGVVYATKQLNWKDRIEYICQRWSIGEAIVKRRLYEVGIYLPFMFALAL
jgi:Zn-dependent peptidase ImmA (M78 family)